MNVLARAAEKLHRTGWTQNVYRGNNGSYCAVGAINYVMGFDTTSMNTSEEVKVLAEVIRENYPEIEYHGAADSFDKGAYDNIVMFFNDGIAKSSTEVIAMMEKAAIKMDEAV